MPLLMITMNSLLFSLKDLQFNSELTLMTCLTSVNRQCDDVFLHIYIYIYIKYLICNIILVSSRKHSDSVFLQIILHLSYYKIMAIFPCNIQHILLLIYFIQSSLCFLISYPILLLPPSLSPLVTASLFSIPVSHFLFCYMHPFT